MPLGVLRTPATQMRSEAAESDCGFTMSPSFHWQPSQQRKSASIENFLQYSRKPQAERREKKFIAADAWYLNPVFCQPGSRNFYLGYFVIGKVFDPIAAACHSRAVPRRGTLNIRGQIRRCVGHRKLIVT